MIKVIREPYLWTGIEAAKVAKKFMTMMMTTPVLIGIYRMPFSFILARI